MIIVTGATGRLGRRTVERLLERVPAGRVGVSVRDPRKAGDLAARGVRVRQGSFDDPASLVHAFEGAEQVLLVSLDRTGEECVAGHRAAIDAAARAGARRILYTSQMGAAHDSRFQACRDHARTEDLLRATGLPWTSLRNGFYAASALQFLEAARHAGDIALPADGPVAWTGHDDLAEATAVILTEEGRFEGPPRRSPVLRRSTSTPSPGWRPRSPGGPSPALSSPATPSASRPSRTAPPRRSPTCC